MPIGPYLEGHRFDAETTRLMGIAFETAVAALHSQGDVEPPRDTIARIIIDLAKTGERDPRASMRGGPESHPPRSHFQRAQSSSASRFTAGAAGGLNPRRFGLSAG